MIPDFKTYLKESLWADVQSQAAGSSIKKEDDVDLMDYDRFADYLENRYIPTTKELTLLKQPRKDFLNLLVLSFTVGHKTSFIYVAGEYSVIFNNCIYITITETIKDTDLFEKLKEKYIVSQLSNRYQVSPKDGSRSTNSFFLEVADFLLENAEPPLVKCVKRNDINESLWADVQSQASGEVVKKEDDVNSMGLKRLYNYVKELYSDYRVYIDIHHNNFISIDDIPVNGVSENLFLVFDWTESEKEITLPYVFRENFENIFISMTEKFSLKYPEAENDDEYEDLLNTAFINIYPKDGKKITNSFFLEVLDYIYKAANNNLTESLWADVQSQAAGSSVKKEDDVDHLSYDEFLNYMVNLYKPTNKYSIHTFVSTKNQQIFKCIQIPIEDVENGYPVTIYYDISGIEQPDRVTISSKLFDIHPELMNRLKEVYDVEKPPLATYTIKKRNGEQTTLVKPQRMTNTVTSKTGSLKNSDCLNILDIVLSMAEKPFFVKEVKESLWADVQSQASGDTVKKEDDVDLMDYKRFVEYLQDNYTSNKFAIYKTSKPNIRYNDVLNEIEVPMLSKGTGWSALLTMEYGRTTRICFGKDIKVDFPELYSQINDNFVLRKERHKRWTSCYVYPDENFGEATNSFFLTVLDFIISTGDKYLIISKA